MIKRLVAVSAAGCAVITAMYLYGYLSMQLWGVYALALMALLGVVLGIVSIVRAPKTEE